MKRWHIVLLCGAIVAALVVFFFGERIQWAFIRSVIGLAEYQHVSHLPEIDEVEICTLQGDATPGDPDPFEGDGTYGVAACKTVRGADAAEIAALWRSLPTGLNYQYMCFSPAYGLRFRHNGKQVLKTSVCWHCQGLTFPTLTRRMIEWGFDAKSPPAQKLLVVLQKHVPLPPPPKSE
jgi:hypothetical protein